MLFVMLGTTELKADSEEVWRAWYEFFRLSNFYSPYHNAVESSLSDYVCVLLLKNVPKTLSKFCDFL